MRLERRLEQYTLQRPHEVLRLSLEVNGTPDCVLVFRGFSSSLMQSTAFDPDIPVIPETAVIHTIDRLEGPYTPDSPRYIQQGMSWDAFMDILAEVVPPLP